MYRALVTDKVHPAGLELLREKGIEVVEDLEAYKPEVLKERIKGFDVLIVRSRTKVRREVIEAADKLKVIARAGSGLDNIDLEAAKEKGIKVVNAPDALKNAVAELVIGMMVVLARRAHYSYRKLLEGEWEKVMGFELAGKTLGVVGFGRIGREVAKKAKALGMNVIAYDVVDLSETAKEMGVEFTQDLEELLRKSDVVSLHVPLTEQTRNMINRDRIKIMKDGAILINAARGEVADYSALLEALESGKLWGVGLDVYPEEPPKSEELLKLIRHPRTFATAHIGAQTEEAQRRTSLEVAQRILEALGLQ
ncbi:D-2-hydroxyacid dehydrogenase [Ignicoccus hospitalis]|uniref:D-isomer specific 2-hydroxyacid dehydrogenase, NAD-binding n=1 Tax=Ignicoccus hospitalis (strain KIN4/I / DSM 18386 / JCM 14125) TaxID=453591 RepID=A8A9G4_IGNH4|nr:D-2-hydroxyacid dehydrogenase [Ignicoccus hospitalis]ABU81566.1 D-isomer specific 2-hydroxyacid dehydrogenase, NAD-binding [Ignicoccus hospitalis KIN4/I]HIH90501.1 NAD(P)-binding domain-containing protein [Desulfurococcaceae archaeon]